MSVRKPEHFDDTTKNAALREDGSGTISTRAMPSNNHYYTMNEFIAQAPLRDYQNIADINVGFISTVRSTTIEKCQSMDEYLSDIKNGTYKNAVEDYRNFISDKMPIELKSDAARNRKASVPCCVPHSYCTSESISNKLPQNGFMQVDIDFPSLGNLSVSKVQMKSALEACPYIFAYHKSIGGQGYVGYAYTESNINEAFWVVAEYMQSKGLYVDLSKGSGTGEKRFMSYDADLVIKEQFVPVEAVVGIDKDSIIKTYTWHKPEYKRLAKGAEKAFANWVEKNGGFDWTSSGPAAPAGLFASVVSKQKHSLTSTELMQLADWCVYLYNDELIVEQERAVWEQYLNQYGTPDAHCTKNSATASAQASAVDWTLVFPGFAVHDCTIALDSTPAEIDQHIRMLIGEKIEEEGVDSEYRKLVHSAISANVTGDEMGVLHYDFRLETPPRLLTNGDCTMLFGCSANSARSVLGTGIDAVWLYSTEPLIGNRHPLSLDRDRRRLTYNPFAKLPEVRNISTATTDEDCEWALWTLFESLAGSREEGETLLDYLSAHWQGLAIGKHQRNRVNDIVIVGEPATGKDLFFDILARSFPAVYCAMTDADLDPDCKGNDKLFTSSLLLMNEAEGSKRKVDNATFKQFCDSPTHRYRGMGKGAVDRPRVGLCIRVCNVLGLTVDGSTARKIAFFQSGASTYDLVTQKPLDPAKSDRLLSILKTGNFILWFRQLLSNRHVEVERVLYGHGCKNFRANNASGLYTLLQAIEAGETTLELSGIFGTFLGVKDLSDYIKKSTVAREAGERPSTKINEMIKTGQLQWQERRHQGGRLYGYELPAQEHKVFLAAQQPAIAPPSEHTDEQLAEIHQQLPSAGEQAQSASHVPKTITIRKFDPSQLSRCGGRT